MDSMYGAHAGASFVLSGSFETVSKMAAAFGQGAAYTDVWYNQYVIIDTANKNDKDNGKIYRRGLNYTGTNGGAEYIGQIVGPSSGTPYVQMGNTDYVKSQGTVALEDNSFRKVPISMNEDGSYNIADSGEPGTFEYTPDNNDIRAGKYVDEDGNVKYNDTIQYTWVNIRNDDADSDSWFYVGWSIPYLVTDYTATQVSQYDKYGKITDQNVYATRIDDETHPYYSKWNIGIPKGIKGDALRNMRVIVPTKNDVIYDPAKITIDAATSKPVFPEPGYDGQSDDIASGRKIIVVDYYAFDDEFSPASKMLYLGDFNVIENMSIADNGTLTIEYTHEDDTIYEKMVRWISRVTLYTSDQEDPLKIKVNSGDLVIAFNDGTYYKPHLEWPNGIDIADDGTVTIHYIGKDDVVYEKYLKWIDNVTLSTGEGKNGGKFTTTYNNGSEPYVANLRWLKDFQLADNGTLTWTYSGTGAAGENEDTGQVIKNKALRWPVSATLSTGNGSAGGAFTITYNNNNDGSTSGSTTKTFPLRWANSITLGDDGTVTTTYSGTGADGEDAATGQVIQSKKVKWITDTTLDVDNGKLHIDYNTGDGYDAALTWVKDISIAEDGTITLNKTTEDEILDQKLSSVTKARVNDDGTFVLDYNTGDSKNVKDQTGTANFKLKVLKNLSLAGNNEGTGIIDSKKINVLYNTGEKATIGDPINFIQNMVVRTSDYHLFVLFSDPSYRKTNSSIPSGTTDSDWIENSELRKNVPSIPDYYSLGVTEGVYWRDYGSIKDSQGLLVGINVTLSQVQKAGYNSIAEYLAGVYPTGRQDQKVITYDDGTEQKTFYAFDYTTIDGKYVGWYSLGTISETNSRDVYLGDASTYDDGLNKLPSKGIFFEKTYVDSVSTDMPKYWAADYAG